jgi:signal transduction histidine kinase
MVDHSTPCEPATLAPPRGGPAPSTPVVDRDPDTALLVPGREDIRFFYLLSLPIWLATAIRAADDTSFFDGTAARVAAVLLVASVVLLVTERPIRLRFGWYPRLYLPIQTAIVPVLIFLLPDLDYFAILFIPLCAQVMTLVPRSAAVRWVGVFTVVMALALLATQDWPKSLALVVMYGAAFLFVVSYAAARYRSEALVTELQGAYRRLETSTAQVEALAVVEERNRLARDLHDSVTQALYGLTLSAEAARRQIAAGQVDSADRELRDLAATAQHALQEMRLLIFELRPPVLEEEGLAAALQARLQAVEGRVGVATTLAVEGDGALPPAVEAEFDRISQEALNNALKHARAHRIAVDLHQDELAVTLEIADDGIGFDPDAARTRGGLGLRGMAERAARVGGRLVVDSRPGQGTRVRVVVPR